jgi:hypothetical protein
MARRSAIEGPPAANGMMSVIGRLGKSAAAACAPSPIPKAAASAKTGIRIASPPALPGFRAPRRDFRESVRRANLALEI